MNDLKLLDPLLHFLEIPSVSTNEEHVLDMEAARHFLTDFFLNLDFKVKILRGSKHDAVYAEYISNKNNPTVLIYGHYDVQPAEPLDEWKSDPFKPVLKNGNIYARGATDNKAQIMIHAMAVKSLLDEMPALPLNFKFIIEGEEEIGSPSVERFVQKYADNLLKCDYLFVSDSEMIENGKPTIDISLRGLLYTEIEIQTSKYDLHSGQFGGVADNPINILSNLIANLKREDGKILIPDFYKNVSSFSLKEKNSFSKIGITEEKIKKDAKIKSLSKAFDRSPIYNRLWGLPTLDVNGIWGGYQEKGSKTIIPSKAGAKISMRLVPNQDADEVYDNFVKYISKIIPKTAEYKIIRHADCFPYKAPTSDPIFDLVKQSLKKEFGREPVFAGVGGSIGFIPIAANYLNIPVIMVGFGLPTDNLHAPNENFSLSNYYKGINAMRYFYSNLNGFVKYQKRLDKVHKK